MHGDQSQWVMRTPAGSLCVMAMREDEGLAVNRTACAALGAWPGVAGGFRAAGAHRRARGHRARSPAGGPALVLCRARKPAARAPAGSRPPPPARHPGGGVERSSTSPFQGQTEGVGSGGQPLPTASYLLPLLCQILLLICWRRRMIASAPFL